MDSATGAIAVISLLICSVPFIIDRNNRKKREKEMVKQLKDHAKNETLQLTKFDLQSNLIIGLDDLSNTLYFLIKKEGVDHFQQINLANYKSCELQQSNRELGDQSKSQSVVDRLSLQLNPSKSSDQPVLIEFFNRSETVNLSGEFQLARDWEKLLRVRFH